MKRLIGANELLRDIHDLPGTHPRTQRPLTRALALADLADTQYASAEDAGRRWHAVLKVLKAAHTSDEILLEDEDHSRVEEMVEAGFVPPAMERHQYQQGALVQLGDWLRTAEEVEVEAVRAEGSSEA